MLSAAELRSLRRKLGQKYSEILKRRVVIQPEKSRVELLKFRIGGTVFGELASVDGSRETALSQRGKRDVHPLYPASLDSTDEGVSRCWVDWSETWRCVEKGKFDLQNAAWTLYWGYAGDEIKTQVLRAEWDQLHRLDSTPSNAGHPHWHIDTEIPLQQIDAVSVDGVLEELSDEPESNLTIQKIHLAMGGWENSRDNMHDQPQNDDNVPECWQYDFSGDMDDLIMWGVRTLRYLQKQANFIRAK